MMGIMCIVYVYTARSGQRETPRLVLEVGGTSAFQAACKVEVPPHHAGMTQLYEDYAIWAVWLA